MRAPGNDPDDPVFFHGKRCAVEENELGRSGCHPGMLTKFCLFVFPPVWRGPGSAEPEIAAGGC